MMLIAQTMRELLNPAQRILCVVTGQVGFRVLRRIAVGTVRSLLGRRSVGSVRQTLKPTQSVSGASQVVRRLVLPVSRSWECNQARGVTRLEHASPC